MRDVWTSLADVTAHLAHNTNVFVAVQQRVFLIFSTCATTLGGLVGLEARIGENDDKSLSILVRGGDRYMLFRDESRKFWSWE